MNVQETVTHNYQNEKMRRKKLTGMDRIKRLKKSEAVSFHSYPDNLCPSLFEFTLSILTVRVLLCALT
jgi:hypothetical protein